MVHGRVPTVGTASKKLLGAARSVQRAMRRPLALRSPLGRWPRRRPTRDLPHEPPTGRRCPFGGRPPDACRQRAGAIVRNSTSGGVNVATSTTNNAPQCRLYLESMNYRTNTAQGDREIERLGEVRFRTFAPRDSKYFFKRSLTPYSVQYE